VAERRDVLDDPQHALRIDRDDRLVHRGQRVAVIVAARVEEQRALRGWHRAAGARHRRERAQPGMLDAERAHERLAEPDEEVVADGELAQALREVGRGNIRRHVEHDVARGRRHCVEDRSWTAH
jgi:hypothetical protein